ncbi:MAG: Gfo/Idh/MocA family oxidoreductase [Acidimicrobiia bacterium]
MRLALAGAGPTGEVHGLAAASLRTVELRGVWAPDPHRARDLARRLRVEAVAFDELARVADGVVVDASLAGRADVVADLVGAGVAVLVEPPVGLHAGPPIGLEPGPGPGPDAARQVAYGEALAHSPALGLALDHLGRVPVERLEVRGLQGPGPAVPTGAEDPVPEIAAHVAALALVAAAPARPVRVEGGRTGGRLDALVHFEGGPVAHLHVDAQAPATAWDLQASGPAAVVRLELAPTTTLERDGVPVALPAPPRGVPANLELHGYRAQLASWAATWAAGRPPAVGPGFARAVADVLAGAGLVPPW